MDPKAERLLSDLLQRMDAVEAREVRAAELQADRFNRTVELMLRIFDREQDDRRRLTELRGTPEYAAAFTEEAPLVSVVIPTLDRIDTLLSRSLPAVLGQSYANLEVVIVGDHASPEMGEAIASLGEPRVKYHNLPMRGPYPEDEFLRWLSSGTSPINTGFQLARGRWITVMADDDRMEPDALATLVQRAQSERLEWVYGKVRQVTEDGAVTEIGSFPPRWTIDGLHSPVQTSLLHAGLSFVQFELAHALFEMPNDVGFTRRLCLAGARVGFVDQVMTTYYPSMRGASAVLAGSQGYTPSGTEAALLTQLAQVSDALLASHASLASLMASRRFRYPRGVRRVLARLGWPQR